MPPYHHESLAMCQVLNFWPPVAEPQELRINAFTPKAYHELKARDRKREHKKQAQKAKHATWELLATQLRAESVSYGARTGVQDYIEGPGSLTRTSITLDQKAMQMNDESSVYDDIILGSTHDEDGNFETTMIPFTRQVGTAQAVLGLPHPNGQSASRSLSFPSSHGSVQQGGTEPSPPLLVTTPPPTISDSDHQSHRSFAIGLECDSPSLPKPCTNVRQTNLDDEFTIAEFTGYGFRQKQEGTFRLRNNTCLDPPNALMSIVVPRPHVAVGRWPSHPSHEIDHRPSKATSRTSAPAATTRLAPCSGTPTRSSSLTIRAHSTQVSRRASSVTSLLHHLRPFGVTRALVACPLLTADPPGRSSRGRDYFAAATRI